MDSKPQSSSEMNGTGAAAGDDDNGDSGDWKLGVSQKNRNETMIIARRSIRSRSEMMHDTRCTRVL